MYNSRSPYDELIQKVLKLEKDMEFIVEQHRTLQDQIINLYNAIDSRINLIERKLEPENPADIKTIY